MIMEKLKENLAQFLFKLGVSANLLTYLGLALALLAGILIYNGEFFWAGGILLLSGLLDLLDGAVARISKRQSPFGGILDSSMDRYGDGFVFAGIVFFYFEMADLLYALLAFSALSGSFLISYVRARAECEIENCKVGFWERGERLVYVSLGLLLNHLEIVLWVLAIGTQLTALSRLYYAHSKTQKEGREASRSAFLQNLLFNLKGRAGPAYLIKILILFLIMALVRI